MDNLLTGTKLTEDQKKEPMTKGDGIMLCGLIKKFVTIMADPGEGSLIMIQNIEQIEKRILGG